MVVSLVLSFLLVWDAPRIRDGIRSLEHSRLSGIYSEVAPSFTVFSSLFGKALQAQVIILNAIEERPFMQSAVCLLGHHLDR